MSTHAVALACDQCDATWPATVLVTDEGTIFESSYLEAPTGWVPRLPAYASVTGARFAALCPSCAAALRSGAAP